MADLQGAPDARGERDQRARLGRRFRDRLLDQHMRSGLEEVARDGEVRRRRSGDAHRIHAAEEAAVILERGHLEFGRHLLARRGTRIDHCEQLAPFGLRVFLRMEASEITHADDRGSDFLHWDAIMPAMSNPPPARGKEPPLERLMQLRAGYAALPRARRELIIFGLALLCGLLAVPLLIW